MATRRPRSPRHHFATPPRSPPDQRQRQDGLLNSSPHTSSYSGGYHRQYSRKGTPFSNELSVCLVDFVISLLPTPEEMAVKEDVRRLLERLIRTIEPQSRLLSFGSTANGFSLKNSDMDLCCLIDTEIKYSASDVVTVLGALLERETKFTVKPLPHARIPIIKLTLDASANLPFGIACDIGFENRLALENTRLLLSYATIDPTRVRTLVLFLKVWSKRRKINSPYSGTLSSYGYVLLVLYYLIHVKTPPVLPNLQAMPPLRPMSYEDMHLDDNNIWFFDDIEVLRRRWKSPNTENVADLLVDFFRYFSRDFPFSGGVASIREGLLQKEHKGWLNESDTVIARDCNRLCIEDPFEITYNVARTVTKDGLFLIRGEFIRAAKILHARHDSPIAALAQLCLEREDTYPLHSPSPLFQPPAQTSFASATASFPPSPSLLSIRPNGAIPIRAPLNPEPSSTKSKASNLLHGQSSASMDTFSLASDPVSSQGLCPAPDLRLQQRSQGILAEPQPIPTHMVSTRSLWTSPPPDASHGTQIAYEEHLGLGLCIATAAPEVREKDYPRSISASSPSNTASERSSEDELGSVTAEVESMDVGSSVGSAGSMRLTDKALGSSSTFMEAQTSSNLTDSEQMLVPSQLLSSHLPWRQSLLKGEPPSTQRALRPGITSQPSGSTHVSSLESSRKQHHPYPSHSSDVGSIGSWPAVNTGSSRNSSRRTFSGTPRPLAATGQTNICGTQLPCAVPYGFPAGPRNPQSPGHFSLTEASTEQFALNLTPHKYQQRLPNLPSPQSGYDFDIGSLQADSARHSTPARLALGVVSSSPRLMPLSTRPPHTSSMSSTSSGGGMAPTRLSQAFGSSRPSFSTSHVHSKVGPRGFRSEPASGESLSDSEASLSPPQPSSDLSRSSLSRHSSLQPAPESGQLPSHILSYSAKRKKHTTMKQGSPAAEVPVLVGVDLPAEPPAVHFPTQGPNSFRKGQRRKQSKAKPRRQTSHTPPASVERPVAATSTKQSVRQANVSDLESPMATTPDRTLQNTRVA